MGRMDCQNKHIAARLKTSESVCVKSNSRIKVSSPLPCVSKHNPDSQL